jgi:hypothetical protein
MANSDIPVTGSAVTALGTFTINANSFRNDTLDQLLVRTQGRELHISVFNGAGAKFEANLVSPGWHFEIRDKRSDD